MHDYDKTQDFMQWEILHLHVFVAVQLCVIFKFCLFGLCHCSRLLEATWDAIVNNTGIVDDSRCMHNSKAVGCMYNRVQNSCNRHSRWWKPQLRKGITTFCLLQDFCKVIQAKTPTDLQLCSCRLYVACHCYGQLTHIQSLPSPLQQVDYQSEQ